MSEVSVVDALGRVLTFLRPPERVVSLVPSDTLNVAAIASADRIVGRTTYCVEPADRVGAMATCGGTKNVDGDAVQALAPDLILANQEENSRKEIERLIDLGLPVYVSFPSSVEASLEHLHTLARMFFLDPKQVAAIAEVEQAMRDALVHLSASSKAFFPVFVPVWMDPLMTFDGRTFAADMLRWAGATNVFDDRARRYPLAADLGLAKPLDAARVGDRDTRYPRVTQAELKARAPALVLLPDEPHPFTQEDADMFRALLAPEGDACFVDGKDLFWYGVRVADALPRLTALINGHLRNSGAK